MDGFKYYFWLLEQTFSGVLYYWQTTLFAFILLALALVLNNPYRIKQEFSRALIVWSHLIITIFILLAGALFQHDTTSTSNALEWPYYLVLALLVTHIPLTGYIVYSLKGFRPFAFVASAVQMYISFWAAFVAVMSVTGDWL